jgi:hypothetical protein
MRRRFIFVLGAGWLISAACSLNPQPLPPEEPSSDVNADGGSDFGGGNGETDAASVPTSGSDSGTATDASNHSDAAAPPPDGGSLDAGDAASDAPPDGEVDGASDAADLDADDAAD